MFVTRTPKYTQVAALYLAVRYQRLSNRPRSRYRDSRVQALRRLAGRSDQTDGIEADDAAAHIDERTAAVSRIIAASV